MWAAPRQWGLLNPPRRPALLLPATRGRRHCEESAPGDQLQEEGGGGRGGGKLS